MANRNKTGIQGEINGKIYENTNEEVTATNLNSVLTDMNDSFFNRNNDRSITGLRQHDPSTTYTTGDTVWSTAGTSGLAAIFRATSTSGGPFNLSNWNELFAKPSTNLNATGAASTIISSNLPISKILQSDTNGKVAATALDATIFNTTFSALSATTDARIPIQSGAAGSYTTSSLFNYVVGTNTLNSPNATISTNLRIGSNGLDVKQEVLTTNFLSLEAPNSAASTKGRVLSLQANSTAGAAFRLITSDTTNTISATNITSTVGMQLANTVNFLGAANAGFQRYLATSTATPTGAAQTGDTWRDGVNDALRVIGRLNADNLMVSGNTNAALYNRNSLFFNYSNTTLTGCFGMSSTYNSNNNAWIAMFDGIGTPIQIGHTHSRNASAGIPNMSFRSTISNSVTTSIGVFNSKESQLIYTPGSGGTTTQVTNMLMYLGNTHATTMPLYYGLRHTAANGDGGAGGGLSNITNWIGYGGLTATGSSGTGTVTNLINFNAANNVASSWLTNVTNTYGFLAGALSNIGTTTNMFGVYVQDYGATTTTNIGEGSLIGNNAPNRWQLFAQGTQNTTSLATTSGNLAGAANYIGNKLAVALTANPTHASDVKALLHVGPSAANIAQLNLTPNATEPTSPNDGDIWVTTTAIRIRIAGVTRTFTIT